MGEDLGVEGGFEEFLELGEGEEEAEVFVLEREVA